MNATASQTAPSAPPPTGANRFGLPAPAHDVLEIGRQLGHDFHRLSRCTPQADWPPSVREGFSHAASTGAARRVPDLYHRKWLQLRLSALQRGRFVSAEVTPAFLARIDVAECPVLRIVLTHGERKPTDWSIDRLNNDAAYAPNNLAVMSTQANLAKGSRSFAQVLALAQPLAPSSERTAGLDGAAWLRLAAMMLGPCFASQPQLTPAIASPIPLPNCTVRTALQQVQHAFASQATRPSGKNALIKQFKTACRDERAVVRLVLLADAVHAGLKGLSHPWDVWLEPPCMERLVAWRQSLNGEGWAMVGATASAIVGGRLLAPSRLHDWHIAARGYIN